MNVYEVSFYYSGFWDYAKNIAANSTREARAKAAKKLCRSERETIEKSRVKNLNTNDVIV